jgi:hypothetical protein
VDIEEKFVQLINSMSMDEKQRVVGKLDVPETPQQLDDRFYRRMVSFGEADIESVFFRSLEQDDAPESMEDYVAWRSKQG